MRRPFTRSAGASASNCGTPRIIASGAAAEAAMKCAMHAAGCWPSASMVSTWLNPAAAAASRPCSTAPPLPALTGRLSTRSAGSASARNRVAEPSVLPSSTTHTGDPAAHAARTVSSRMGPVL